MKYQELLDRLVEKSNTARFKKIDIKTSNKPVLKKAVIVTDKHRKTSEE